MCVRHITSLVSSFEQLSCYTELVQIRNAKYKFSFICDFPFDAIMTSFVLVYAVDDLVNTGAFVLRYRIGKLRISYTTDNLYHKFFEIG